MKSLTPTLYLFGGCNGAGKTTFARAYLTQLDPIPRFLNADEIARGLSPLNPRKIAVKAGKLLLRKIDGCLASGETFGLESTLSGKTYNRLLLKAKSLGYKLEIHYLWIPSAALAIQRITQRVKKGGHAIPDADVERRFLRSLTHFREIYAPLADMWTVWDNQKEPPGLLFTSETDNLSVLSQLP